MLYGLLRRLGDPALAESIVGDLHEERIRRAHQSRLAAVVWFSWAALVVTLGVVRGRQRPSEPRRPLTGWGGDLVHAVRLMRKRPGSTLAAIGTVAVGIGASTAMFSVVNAVLFGLPFRDLNRLALISWSAPRGDNPRVTGLALAAWESHPSGFDLLAGDVLSGAILTGTGEATRLSLERVSASLFPLLGVPPLRGRTFTEAENRPGGDAVAVLAYACWVRQFGSDPAIIGQRITLDGQPVTVLGIMPTGFNGPLVRETTDLWMPLGPALAKSPSPSLMAFGKRAANVSLTAAVSSLEAAFHPDGPRSPGLSVPRLVATPLSERVLGDVRQPLLFLSGAAICILLIACANVAGLLAGLVEDRRRELAVRLALGCPRSRLIRQLLTESVLFGIAGGGLGLALAVWILHVIVSLLPGGIPGASRIAIDGRVLAMCAAVSLGTGVLFGLLPAAFASGIAPGASLAGRDDLGARRRPLARSGLVTLEIALSLALLVGAALLVKTFLHVRPDHPGFDPAGKVVVSITLPAARYPTDAARTVFFDDLAYRLRAQPGVLEVSAASMLPLSGLASLAYVAAGDAGPQTPRVRVFGPVVTPNYFREMAIPVVAGRSLEDRDGPESPPVAVVNEAFARRFSPDRSIVGTQMVVKDDYRPETVKTIVGVVGDTRLFGNILQARMQLYEPLAQASAPGRTLVVHTALDAAHASTLVRHEVAALDPRLPLGPIEAMSAMMERSVVWWHFGASLMTAFAAIALLLAVVGLFGVVAASVAARTREIGVRIALGARPAAVLGAILRRAVGVTALGLFAGLGLALVTTRFLADWMVDVSPLDPSTFVEAFAGMTVLVLIASYLPARRALAIDPIQTLRAE